MCGHLDSVAGAVAGAGSIARSSNGPKARGTSQDFPTCSGKRVEMVGFPAVCSGKCDGPSGVRSLASQRCHAHVTSDMSASVTGGMGGGTAKFHHPL